MDWIYKYQLLLLLQFIHNVSTLKGDVLTINPGTSKLPTSEIPKPIPPLEFEELDTAYKRPRKYNLRVFKMEKSRKPSMIDIALQIAAKEGIDAMKDLYQNIEPEIARNGQILEDNHPAALLSKFSAPAEGSEHSAMAAFATIAATKAFRRNFKESTVLGRQAQSQKVSFRRTPLEGLCPPREPPTCMPASQRYRTHDGTCNNRRRPRWGSGQMPFNRFLPPEYGDGVDSIRGSVEGGPLSSARFVSLLVHGAREGDAPLTLMIVQWGQLLDHDLTSTAQPRSINGSVPSCCGSKDFHPSCFPIKVPLDDPWLAPLKVRCLEFLRSAPAQRRDCVLSWREQTNQVTSFIDASPIYSSNAKTSDNARIFRNGLLVYGRGNPADDVCMRGAIAHQCIRSGDGRSGEQPGLLALHHVWVGEHNRISMELSSLNPHWSDEKVYQESRRIIGALFQHITYREFLPIVLGREVCKLFDIELLNSGYYTGYDPNTNPSVANSFAAAAFRFGHSLVQNSYMRCDRHHNFINNNVTLHEEFQQGDIGTAGSLHRLLRGLAAQRALKRDEFITPELTNHLFQTPGFPFGLDLAAINIQRGRDHGIAPYTAWRQPCGLTPITSWDDLAKVVGSESAKRISHAYRNVHDIDLFVGGIAERPVVGGLVGPTFACIIAQQFSNSRKGDRFWYENPGFESSFTPAQLHSLRHVSLSSILCRAVGSGTFQPHVFIPSDITGNHRVECGKDPLAPIDLRPWLEQDPFLITNEKIDSPISQNSPSPSSMGVQVIKEQKGINNRVHNITMVTHVDFIPNGSIGFNRVANMTKIHDKLDMAQKVGTRPMHKPFEGINNKLDKGRLPIKKLPKPASLLGKRPSTTTRRTVVIHNVEIELRSAAMKAQKNKKKKTDRDMQRELIASEAQNTIMKVAGVVRSQMNAAIEAWEPRTEEEDDDILTENSTKTNEQISSETVTDYTTEEPFDTTDKIELPTETETTTGDTNTIPYSSQTDLITEQQTFEDGSPSTLKPTTPDNSSQSYEDFQAIIDSALQDPTDQHVRVHRSPGYNQFRVRGVELSTHLGFADKLRTLKLDKTETFQGRQLTGTAFEFPLEAKLNYLEQPDLQAALQLESELPNITVSLPKVDRTTTDNPATLRNIELRQYHERPIYNRPQKLILDGPNSDQYEIEINIRQTNPKPQTGNPHYVDYNNPNKRYDSDRYIDQQHAHNYPQKLTSDSNYYSQTTRAPYVAQTKPPTIIYINEHDERTTTTTRPPGFFQNILSFATNGFGGNKHQTETPSNNFPHTPNRIMNSGTGHDNGYSPTSSNYLNSPQVRPLPQLKPSSTSYLSSPHSQSFSKPTSGNYLSAQQSQPFPPPQGFPQQGPTSFNPVGGIPHGLPPHALPPHGLPPPQVFPVPGANSFSSASNAGGLSHASSSAVSTGHFGAIVGSASSAGSDSTFSFNIRPSSRPQPNLVSPTGIRPNYEGLPPRRSQYSSTPSYAIPPKPISTVESFHYPPNRQDPFSSYTRRPPPPYYNERPTNVFDPAYDDLGRSELKVDENGNTKNKTNETKDYNGLDSGEYDYNDDDDDETSGNTHGIDNDVDEELPATKFDKDGYLRPEHMVLFRETSTNKTKLNATELDDNFVLPVLKQDDKFIETVVTNKDYVNATNATGFPDVEQKSFNNDILAEDYDERTSFLGVRTAGRGEKRRRPAINLQIAFAPIKILTKPERPDNWVMFDTPEEKPFLPILPDYNTDTMAAAEVPMPFDELRISPVSTSTTEVPMTTEQSSTALDAIMEEITTLQTTIEETTRLSTLTDEQTTLQPEVLTDTTTDVTTNESTTLTDRTLQELDTVTTTERTLDLDTTTVNILNYTTEVLPTTTDAETDLTTDKPTTNLQTDQQTESTTYALTDPLTDLQTDVNLT